MILQPHAANGLTGRVTDAERQAARGHAPLAICLPPGNPELPWMLERLLFDHGYAVHVIQEAIDLGEAVRTTLAAGLIAIVQPGGESDAEILRTAVPLDRRVTPELIEGSPEDAARQIWMDLEDAGRLGTSSDPLTGGAGI